MSTEVRRRTRFPGGRVLRDGSVLYWWAEVLAILGFYLVYSAIRNAHGANPPHAFQHADQVMALERHLWLLHESTIQDWALHLRPLIISANYFYGSFHFIVTIFAGVFLFTRWSDDYPRFRNALGITTALALIGFTFYPLAPPRMFPSMGFVDTLLKDPTFWSFDSGAMKNVSNQFAAMPSVHIAWATWCAFALAPRLKNRVWSTLAACYPVMTFVVIVITANHWILDAVGGLVIFTLGWIASGFVTRAGRGEPVVT